MICTVELIDDSMLIMHIVLCQLGELSFFSINKKWLIKQDRWIFLFLYP